MFCCIRLLPAAVSAKLQDASTQERARARTDCRVEIPAQRHRVIVADVDAFRTRQLTVEGLNKKKKTIERINNKKQYIYICIYISF